MADGRVRFRKGNERRIETAGQFLVAERLAQEANSPGVKHVISDPLIRKRGNKDNRSSTTFIDQALQQFDTAQAGHMHIENQATGLIRVGIQKLLGRGERARRVAKRPDQCLH